MEKILNVLYSAVFIIQSGSQTMYWFSTCTKELQHVQKMSFNMHKVPISQNSTVSNAHIQN